MGNMNTLLSSQEDVPRAESVGQQCNVKLQATGKASCSKPPLRVHDVQLLKESALDTIDVLLKEEGGSALVEQEHTALLEAAANWDDYCRQFFSLVDEDFDDDDQDREDRTQNTKLLRQIQAKQKVLDELARKVQASRNKAHQMLHDECKANEALCQGLPLAKMRQPHVDPTAQRDLEKSEEILQVWERHFPKLKEDACALSSRIKGTQVRRLRTLNTAFKTLETKHAKTEEEAKGSKRSCTMQRHPRVTKKMRTR
uniref:Uncharacterized protein n=1 Tax=Eutreptiella gymnastica TaxID=73025 RepID=A0A7S4GEQ0_9EUGL